MEEGTGVLVVGGGLAGLAAAAFAARAGAAVRLLERSSEPGGRARTRDQQGFLFNVGATPRRSRARAQRAAGPGRRVRGRPRGYPRKAILQVELDQRGLIRRIYSVSATRRLAGLR